MKWINNLISYAKNSDKGKCPFCGSDHVKITETTYGRGSLTSVCENCKKLCHVDGKVMKDEILRDDDR